jgi:GH25 family lysozyme M1 (1,4-beta-N-acetylmuramidase)
MSNKVDLIDPNGINTISEFGDKGIPQYQDMYIFVELAAISRGRTVLTTSGGFNDPSVIVNLIGVNQIDAENNSNNGNFTTNYYDGSTGEYINYESFGIESIKIKIDSSYVPQINIRFVDIRGVSFFNQNNSPYRIMFDFPPPIFQLKVKGYYGHPLKYQMHMVKYNTDFQANTGNFYIDAQFIALTYAPLTDVLFRYIVNFPLMDEIPTNSDTTLPPNNTYELYQKVKNLYSVGADKIKADVNNKKIEEITTTINAKIAAINYINDIKNNSYLTDETVSAVSPPNLVVYENPGDGSFYNYTIVNNTSQYDEMLKAAKDGKKNSTFGLYLNMYTTNTSQTSIAYEAMKKWSIGLAIAGTDISGSEAFFDNFDTTWNIKTGKRDDIKHHYVNIDLTKYYKLVTESIENDKLNKKNSLNELDVKINETVIGTLGMMPTVYNVFKIILDDVDKFFSKLAYTSRESQNHHSDSANRALITDPNLFRDNSRDKELYAFPLCVKEKVLNCVKTESRVAPIELSQKCSTKFPELKLIDEFIKTFQKQKKINEFTNKKNETTDDGNSVWIPVSPYDASLGTIYNDANDASTPYLNVHNIEELYEILLQRFYILSQSALSKTFYDESSSSIRDFYAKAEARNLITSLDQNLIQSLQTNVENVIKKNASNFYNFIEKSTNVNLKNTYISNDNETIPLAKSTNSAQIYKRANSNYSGVFISAEDKIDELTPDKDSTNLVVKKLAELVEQPSWLSSWFGAKNEFADMFGITTKNLFSVNDIIDSGSDNAKATARDDRYNAGVAGKFSVLDVEYWNCTRYIIATTRVTEDDIDETYYIDYAKTNGNFSLLNKTPSDPEVNNVFESLCFVFEEYGWDIHRILNSSNVSYELKKLLILSNFGNTLSFFAKYPKDLNFMLTLPAILQIPAFLIGYYAMLLEDNMKPGEKLYIEFDNLINNKALDSNGNNIVLSDKFCHYGIHIFADIHDILKLSENDKSYIKEFANSLDYFNSTEINKYIKGFIDLINDCLKDGKTLVSSNKDIDNDKLKVAFGMQTLEGEGQSPKVTWNPAPRFAQVQDFYYKILTKFNFVNYNNSLDINDTIDTKYISLKTTNLDSTLKKPINDTFFTAFFNELTPNIPKKADELKKENKDIEKMSVDEDIITQTYYSFKNINDKWLTNLPKDDEDCKFDDPKNSLCKGYPFNEPGKALIDSFVFVDRAMNPIGDTMLNTQILLDIYEDPNISVYSVLSQLLSLNGFEFFPLQNFMNFSTEKWKESFLINTGEPVKTNPTFVCMYIGGTSSYPTRGLNLTNNGFEDDCIVDLKNATATDFAYDEKCIEDNGATNDDTDKQETDERNKTVKAFKVRFGEQNQSMFTDIKIDSKDYPETNESIQILSQLAGDNKPAAPTPKGQNLFSLYENRSYKATITGLGNVMIQPTQYFQLENIPMYNGAYIILSVEHNISANKMMTSFSGMKILKYPIPRVTDASALFGVDGGDSDETGNYSASNIYAGTQAETISQAKLDKLNSVFGIDVSYAQGNINWNKITIPKGDGYHKPDWVIIKTTQGTTIIDKKAVRNATGVKNAGIKATYYHFAQPYTGNNIIDNAKEQAKYFLTQVKALSGIKKPDFPLVVDFEHIDSKGIFWSNNKTNNDLWLKTFIAELKTAGYDTIIYGGGGALKDCTSANFSPTPLWLSQYIEPELNNPNPPKGWDWTIWQFSSMGKVNGITENTVDINAMKKTYFDKYPLIS